MSALKASDRRGFDSIGERVEKGQFSHPPKRGGYMYYCDGMPTLRGCSAFLIVTRRLARVGVKKGSGWLVCYGLEPRTPESDLTDPAQLIENRDIVLTFCPPCAAVVQEAER